MKHPAAMLAVGASLAARAALALPPDHGPFGPEEDRALYLPACEFARQVTGDNNDWEGTVEFSKGATRLSLHVQAFGIDELRVFEGSTPVVSSLPVALDLASYGDVREPATCADLNGDGRVDFAVTIWQHGNGLGAEFYWTLVGLSMANGYRFWNMDTMGAADFVTFGDRAPIAMLSTSFIQSGRSDYPGPDQAHSYYAYDLWQFRGGDVVAANSIDARFPKYVLMTYKENHKPSIRMSKNRPSVAGKPPQLLGVVGQR
jgi:hypothetical protein